MNICSESMTITVPQKKWDKLMNKISVFTKREVTQVTSKTIQKIRGLAISFYHAVPMARLYIRRQTEAIVCAFHNNLGDHEYFEVNITQLGITNS